MSHIHLLPGQTEPLLDSGDRYEIGELLGSGGMGRVFKAWDRKLKRTVALKIIGRDSAEVQDRFIREAQAQARVDHENVCRIYDTGFIAGQPYIAMQHIEGKSLSAAYPELSIEEKVRAIAQAARGVHAAHRLGIIHRDIKPANLMVTGEGSEIRTSVLDFGLARDMAADGMTSTGIVIGTVQYIAPEQATGEIHKLDRRTDVYGLGVALYEILAGRVPFDGVTPLDTLVCVIHNEPPRFDRRLEIPEDLETIVLKCLEKEQHRRYDSADELAKELDRFLAGEPIKAKRASMFYRLSRIVRRNRHAAAMVLSVIVVASAIGGIALRRAYVAERAAAYAQIFEEDVRYVEALIQHAHTSPLHDVTREREHARAYVLKLEENVREAGPIARGPGRAAVGAALLAIGDVKEAQVALEEAWETGYRTPQLAYALGTVRGRAYQERLLDIERLLNKSSRQAARREADARYRASTLDLLKQARGVKEQPAEFLEALIAYYDRRYDDAQASLDTVLYRYPWLYEARVIRAGIARDRGNDEREKGNYDQAAGYYASADTAFLEALGTAPSDPEVHEELCGLWVDQIQFEVESRGGDVLPHIRRAESACNAALVADPLRAGAHWRLGTAYARLSQWQYKRDIDFRATAERACRSAERGVELAPDQPGAHHARAIAYFWRSTSPLLSEAERLQYVDRSLESSRRLIALNPGLTHAYTLLGNAGLARHNAMIVRGTDPREILREAIRAYDKAIELDPRYMSPYNNSGHAWTHYGDYERLIGVDPVPSYKRAAERGRKGHEANPAISSPVYVVANANRAIAEYQLERGIDPAQAINESLRWSRKEIEVAPEEPGGYFMAALSSVLAAQHDQANGRNYDDQAAQAEHYLQEGLNRVPDSLIAHLTMTRLRLWQASDRRKSVAERARVLDPIVNNADHVLNKHKHSAELMQLLAGCVDARADLDPARTDLRARARQIAAEATALNPLLARYVERQVQHLRGPR